MDVIKLKFEEKRLQSKSEWKIFTERINEEIVNCDWKTFECGEIKSVITTFEEHLEKFCKLCSEVEANFGTKADEFGFNMENDKLIASVRENINSGKIRIAEIKEENEIRLKEKLDAEAKEKKIAETEK